MFLKSMKQVGIIATAFICSTGSLLAAEGGYSGGGGDAKLEMSMADVRDELKRWISLPQQGPRELVFLNGVTYETYVEKMKQALEPNVVILGTITRAEEESATDPDLKVEVNGVLKACRGKVWARDGKPHIQCNIERAKALSPTELFRQMHHEYAGLVGIERNVGASSDYWASNQITDFARLETRVRLGANKHNVEEHGTVWGGVYTLVLDGSPSSNEYLKCAPYLKVTYEIDDLVNDPNTLNHFHFYLRMLTSLEPISHSPNTFIFGSDYETREMSQKNGCESTLFSKNKIWQRASDKWVLHYVIADDFYKNEGCNAVSRSFHSNVKTGSRSADILIDRNTGILSFSYTSLHTNSKNSSGADAESMTCVYQK